MNELASASRLPIGKCSRSEKQITNGNSTSVRRSYQIQSQTKTCAIVGFNNLHKSSLEMEQSQEANFFLPPRSRSRVRNGVECLVSPTNITDITSQCYGVLMRLTIGMNLFSEVNTRISRHLEQNEHGPLRPGSPCPPSPSSYPPSSCVHFPLHAMNVCAFSYQSFHSHVEVISLQRPLYSFLSHHG